MVSEDMKKAGLAMAEVLNALVNETQGMLEKVARDVVRGQVPPSEEETAAALVLVAVGARMAGAATFQKLTRNATIPDDGLRLMIFDIAGNSLSSLALKRYGSAGFPPEKAQALAASAEAWARRFAADGKDL